MLRLLSLLQHHRFWPGGELADRLGVSPRTLRRDVDRLRELGYPVDASRGVAGGYQLRAGTALPPLVLDDDEAVAVAVGLRTAAAGAVAGVEEASVQALAKVVKVMPPRLRRRVEALGTYTVPALFEGPTVDAAALTVIAQCCRDGERLAFGYTTHSGETASRLVEPHRLVALERRWYLVAWDVERHDWRNFRLDRITDPEPTRARFRPRELPGGDPVAFVRAGISGLWRRKEARVTVRAPAAEVEPAVGRWVTVEPLDARSCRMVLSADSWHWVAMALGVVGAPFEVESPPELREHLRSLGELFTRAAGAGGEDGGAQAGPDAREDGGAREDGAPRPVR
ncbi:YafY family protein [Streptomyces capparidis]